MVFCFALTSRPGAMKRLRARIGLYARSLIAMFFVAPLIAITLGLTLDLDRAMRAAIVVLALSPVPPILPRQEIALRGSTSYALGLLAVATFFSILIVPLGLAIIGWLVDRPLQLPIGVVARFVALSVLLPLAAGAIVGRLAPAVAERLAKPLSMLASGMLAIALLVIITGTWPQITGELRAVALVAIALATTASFAVGHVLGGPDPDDRSVLGLSTATRHPGVALAVCGALAPEDATLATGVLVYFLGAAILSFAYTAFRARVTPARA
jgi:BASS family bile acid:Na+ symporter